MSHVLVGDGHYRGTTQERAQWTRLVGKLIADQVSEFSVMGDFFELWIGLRGVMPRWQSEMLEELEPLKRAGTRIRYVIGNKDYFVEEWNARSGLFDAVVDGVEVCPSPQGDLHLAHGDLVNRADRQYRTWRAFSRSWPIRTLARILPRPALSALGSKLSKTLESTNKTHKMYFPEDELEARARELPPGPATQIYGHFHVHRELRFDEKRVITLPFLATENAGVLVDDHGFHRYEA
ncbi:MAG: hypothetical protein AAF654_03835 [Myxococcota bacterium]